VLFIGVDDVIVQVAPTLPQWCAGLRNVRVGACGRYTN